VANNDPQNANTGPADSDSYDSNGFGQSDDANGDGSATGSGGADEKNASGSGDNSNSAGETGSSGTGQSASDSSGLENAQSDADENMSSSPVGSGVEPCGSEFWNDSSTASEETVSPNKKSWIAIKLVDQDGEPVPGEEYRITLPDGSTVEGDLDKGGFARVNGIDPGTCQVSFPTIDRNDWNRI